MKLKPLIVLSSVATILLNGCSMGGVDGGAGGGNEAGGYAAPGGEDVEQARKRLVAARAPGVSSSQGRTLPSALNEMRDRYRPRPDRRFLIGLAAVDSYLRGNKEAAPVISMPECTFREGKWRVLVSGKEVAALSEFPSYDEMASMLERHAVSLVKESRKEKAQARDGSSTGTAGSEKDDLRKKIRGRIEEFSPESLIGALKELARARRQSELSAEDSALVARALVLLNLQNIDVLNVADRVPAQALAWLTLARVDSETEKGADKIDLQEDAVLLSHALGYYGTARRKAGELPLSNSVRQYVLGMKEPLAASASKPSASRLERYLCLKLLSAERMTDEWSDFVRRNYSSDAAMALPVLATVPGIMAGKSLVPLASFLMIDSIESATKPVASRKPVVPDNLVWSEPAAAESAGWMLKGLLNEFESVARKEEDKALAPLLSEEDIYQFRLSYFASGAFFLSEAFFHLPSFRKRCLDFAYAQKVPATGAASDLKRFMLARMELRTKERSMLELMDEVESMRSLGPAAALRFWRDFGWFREAHDRESIFPAGQKLFRLVDSRPSLRSPLSDIAREGIVYRRLAGNLSRAAEKEGARFGWDFRSEYLRSRGNFGDVARLLSQKRLHTDQYLQVLKWCARDGAGSKDQIREAYFKASKRDPASWLVVEQGAAYLTGNGLLDEAERLVKSFIENNKSAAGGQAAAKCLLAEICLREKKYTKGLDTINSVKDSENFQWLRVKALLLQALGRREEAEEWAGEFLKRYPSLKAAIVLAAQIYWLNGKYAEAARVLRQGKGHMTTNDWGASVFPAFYDVFHNEMARGYLAVSAIKDSGIAGMGPLGQLSRNFYSRKKADYAFMILSQVAAEPGESMELVVEGYRYLKSAKGKDEALRWIRAQVKEQDREAFADLAFGALGLSELLWEFVPEAPSDQAAPRIFLLRAADLASSNYKPDGKALQLLRDYFQTHKASLSDAIGRQLLSISGEPQLLTTKMSDKHLCFASFYRGLKALRESKDLSGDSEYYRLCVELNQPRLHEFAWARGWLFILEDQIAQSRFGIAPEQIDSANVFVDSADRWSHPTITLFARKP